MDLGFKKVIDKIVIDSPSVSHISLYSWGEPLLHPQISEIVEYIHKYDIAVALSSNLSIRFDERIDKLLEMSPEYIKVSVSGYYPDVYKNTHQGGDINLVKSNLYRLRYLLDKYKSTTLVDINYHLYRDNCGKNYKKFEELAAELDFAISKTFALVMPLERVLAYYDGIPDSQTEKLQQNLLVTIDEGVQASKKTRLPKGVCPFRENQVNINADLSVPVCCTTFQRGENIMAANYLNSNLSELNMKKRNAKICGKCMELALPEYNMGFNKSEWEKIASDKVIFD
jgi:MoaA/NifB/PqqE/SkfB family radical SAM enzyme